MLRVERVGSGPWPLQRRRPNVLGPGLGRCSAAVLVLAPA